MVTSAIFLQRLKKKISRKTSKDTESTAEEPRKDAAFRKKEKSPKKEPKAPTNLFSEHDELPNDVEKFSEAYPEVLEKPVEVTAKSSPKKKHPKKLPKTTENLADHDELPNDANEFSQASHQEFREPVEATIKSSSSESSAKARSPSKPSEKNIEEQKHDPSQAHKEPPKRPVKKITKVPAAELVTLGEEYKIKKVNEKPCRDCNEPVKIKMKTRVRDMGTQTIESAVMNGLRTRGRPKGPPKVKKQDPVSVKDRIITPRQPTDQDEFIDMHHKPKPLTQEQIEQLRSMTVSLKHPVPPQHDVEVTAGCRPLTSEEKENFKAFETLKIGVWRVEEDRTIVKNWKKFCKRHSWNPDITAPFTSWRHKGAYYIPQMDERKKFLQFLAHGLSNRSLYNVYMRFKNLYSTHRIERYSPLEDATLMAEIENNPNFDKTKYLSQLAEKLNRTRHSIWRRYQILKKKAEAADDV
uniref:Uncharacterized protein n=1 Tax=Fopius arisanus TaxID=64838 RepID=A0A0C9RDQ1_9HYME